MLLAAHYEVLSLREAGLSVDIEETGSTFAENARLKAEAVMRLARCAALADDSGLSVDALGGAPGVYSARYAGTHGDDAANNRLLLQNMRDARDRAARFVSALALAAPGEETRSVQGEVSGTITDAPRGEGGFGYDPLFEYERGRTFAEMPDREKNEVSHRANAVRALLRMLEAGTC
ncbi:MAG: RdgB/HAM1 family non-canonical purine NTP pyrophosphatase [Clostridia bacterium]|nr:RdgB/HAM1 family non-canonical purine NTP pyrophosphatase [Clostridia bacterium]